MAVPADYDGPIISFPLSLANVVEVLEAFRERKLMHAKYVMELLRGAIDLYNGNENLVRIGLSEGQKLTVVGDLHGQIQDLFSIFTLNSLPSENNLYVFNGDFVDRGAAGVEVVITLLLFKLLLPNHVFMNRGNHESRQQNRVMGFEDEVRRKYRGATAITMLNTFQQLFDALPLATLIQEKIFVVHGGLFRQDGVTFGHVESINRKREPPIHGREFEDQIFEALLWSDPRRINGRQLSARGAGVEFGQEVTFEFLRTNRVALVVRSHECVQEGFELLHQGRLITLFSASYYCGVQTNKGAFMCVGPDLQPEIQQFYAAGLEQATWEVPENLQNRRLEEENVKMITERIVDQKPALFWQFSVLDKLKCGKLSRLDWSRSLRLVLDLDLPYLIYQPALAELEEDGLINYSKFLDRYRVEISGTMADAAQRWQEAVISKICEKLYITFGAGDLDEAFSRFDVDNDGYIQYQEFIDTLKALDVKMTNSQIYELMRGIDQDKDSKIDPREFAQRFDVIFERVQLKSAGTQRGVLSVGAELEACLLQLARAFYREMGGIEAAFRLQAQDATRLTYDQFKAVLEQINSVTLSEEEKQDIAIAVDLDNDGYIDAQEFAKAFRVRDVQQEDYRQSLGMSAESTSEAAGDTWQERVLQQISNFFYQNRHELSVLFRVMDVDNSGYISKDEFREGCSRINDMLKMPVTADDVEGIMEALDTDGDGFVSYDEFINGFKVVDRNNPNADPELANLPAGGGLRDPRAVARVSLVDGGTGSVGTRA